MHIPGVKQEQPDVKSREITGPLLTTMTVRDRHNVRLGKITNGDPHKAIEILKILANKADNNPIYVDTVIRDGGNNRVLSMTGENDTRKMVKIIKSLSRKVRRKGTATPCEEPACDSQVEEDDGTVVIA